MFLPNKHTPEINMEQRAHTVQYGMVQYAVWYGAVGNGPEMTCAWHIHGAPKTVTFFDCLSDLIIQGKLSFYAA